MEKKSVKFHRNEIKYAFMQHGYGQQEKGTRNQLAEDMGSKYDDYIYDVFMQAVEDIVPGFSKILHFVNELWNPRWLLVQWSMPDGLIVSCKPTASEWVDFKLFDQLSVKAKVSGVRKEKQALILYVGFIHAVDAYIARQMVERCDFDIITIHDDFKCHPNNAHMMKHHYREILADINDAHLFESFISQITGQEVEQITGSLKTSDILASKYAIC